MVPKIVRSRALARAAAGLALSVLASCSAAERGARDVPPPTGILGSGQEEGASRQAREAWEELLHRAPPGVSWRAVEAENRRRSLEARAALIEQGLAAEPLGTWRERGSFDQTGRNLVTAVGTDGKTLFIGSATGGVFSGLPGGRRWTPRSDGLGIGVQSFVAVPGKPEVWVAADETSPLYVTTNRGVTWSEAAGGPPDVETVVRILRDPGKARRVYVLTDAGPAYKLYRSDDGGIRFAVVSSGPNIGLPDLWIDRVHGGPLYLALQKELRKSTDGGVTFRRIGPLPVTAQAVKLVGSEAGAPTFYAVVRPLGESNWSLYVSEDAGRTWRAGGSPLPFFWGGLNASITNPRLLFFGGVNAYRSADAGRTFQPINEWFEYYARPDTRLHADVLGIDCVLYQGKEVVFFNTDGGTFLSQDGGRTVRNITRFGFGNGQYYSLLTSANDSRRIAAGSQDQGYQVSRPSGRAVLGFDQLLSGDYGSLTSSDGTHDRLYSSYPGFILVQMREGEKEIETLGFPAPLDERAQFWIAPLAADPDDPDVVFYGDRRIWRAERQEPNVYTTEALPHDFSEDGYVIAFALSPADRNRWYAGTVNGRPWASSDGGATWRPGDIFEFFVPTDVLPSPTDPDVCYVAGSGYGNGISVYRTTDGGATWQPYTDGLPQTVVRALAFDDPVRQTLYAATQAGPFRYDEGSASWVSLLGTQAPLTLYVDVEGVPAEGVVRFATFGRGIWDFTPR